MEPVRNHRNKLVVDAARFHRARARRARGKTLIEGPNLLRDARTAGAVVTIVFALQDHSVPGAVLVDRRAMERLSGTETPRGPVAVVDIPAPKEVGDRDVLVSVGVSDPGNVGTLIRTAASFGMAFAYTPGSADPWAPKTLRAGAGGQFQTPIVQIDTPAALNRTLVALVVEGGVPPSQVEADRVAILVGEESSGLPETVSDDSDIRVTIPTPGSTESLNAAVAAGIVVYEISKRKGNPASGV